MDLTVRIVVFLAGAALVVATLLSAVRTTVLPRSIPSMLTRVVFAVIRRIMRLIAGPRPSYARRDRVMAYYGPIGLFAMLATWLALVFLGYAVMFWAQGHSPRESFIASGSSLFTLGFDEPLRVGSTILVFTEAAIGLMLLALLITFLPSLYSAYSQREAAVTRLAVRAGTPPSGVRILILSAELGFIEHPHEIALRWGDLQDWFAGIAETHQSFPALTFFRSPQPDRSWITAAGAALDAATLRTAVVDAPRDLEAEFCVATGTLALNEVARYFGIVHAEDHPDPASDISISRQEFDAACEQMAAAGVPLRQRDDAWTRFATARAGYDRALVMMCRLVDAPEAPWSSDRDRTLWIPKLNPRAVTR